MKRLLNPVAIILLGLSSTLGSITPVVAAGGTLTVLNVDANGDTLLSPQGNMQVIAITPNDTQAVISTDAPNFAPGFSGTNGTQEFFHNLTTRINTPIGTTVAGGYPNASLQYAGESNDQHWVVYNTNATNMGTSFAWPGQLAYLQNTQTGQVINICNTYFARSACKVNSITPDGYYIGVSSGQAYVINLITGQIIEASQSLNPSTNSVDSVMMSPDDSSVAFFDYPNNASTVNIYSYNVATGSTIQVDTSSSGVPANNAAYLSDHYLALTANNSVVFSSYATNLVPGVGDGNLVHVFYKNLTTGVIQVVDANSNGSVANGTSYRPTVDSSGTYVAFDSLANNLDSSGVTFNCPSCGDNTYVKDMANGAVKLIDQDAQGNVYAGASTFYGMGSTMKNIAFTSGNQLLDGPSSILTNNYAYLTPNPFFATTPAINSSMLDGTALSSGNAQAIAGAANTISVLTAEGDEGSVTYSVDGGAQIPTSFNIADNAWEDTSFGSSLTTGAHSLTITATDAAGSVTSPSYSFQVVNTPAGSNVSVTPTAGVTLTFSNVTIGGVSTASSATPPPVNGIFRFGPPQIYYNISTTAAFTGNVLVCFNYSPASIPGGSTPHLFHYHNGVFTDITTSDDTVNGVICGTTTDFSGFGVALEPDFQGLVNTISAMDIKDGIINSLDAKYLSAQAAIADDSSGDYIDVVNQLNAALNEIQAQEGKGLSAADAQTLTNMTNEIISFFQ